MSARNLLLTGPPGIGKTTAIRRIAELLSDRRLAGFYTDEVRVGGERRGFRIVTLDGRAGLLADVRLRSRWHVGKYGVNVEGFGTLVCPMLETAADTAEIVLVDEIGKMECLSRRFVQAVERQADAPVPLVATIAARGSGPIAAMKSRPDARLFELTHANRDALPAEIAALILS